MNKKRGFTLVELMVVIIILAVLALISVPIYTGIRENVNNSLYESKTKELLAKGEEYAEESGRVVFHPKTLFENGKISPDNETGEYKDPRNGRDMACDIINVKYEDNNYHASITENEICYSEEELENLYGMVELYVTNEAGNEIDTTDWQKYQKVKVQYRMKSGYENLKENIKEILWTGGEERICNKENLGECASYEIETTSVRNVKVNIRVTVEIEGGELLSNSSKEIKLDIEKPVVLDGSIILNNEVNTSGKRKVEFELSDGSGSGVKEYSLVTNKTCQGASYKSASDGIQTEYLNDGTYYICVKDKVGNMTEDSDLENERNVIKVENVDSSKPVIASFTIESRESYKGLKVRLKIKASDGGISEGLKMCVSNDGYLVGCNWEEYKGTYANGYDWTLKGTLDGGRRTVYVSIQDQSGNIVNRTATYDVYKECSSTKKVYTQSDYGACSKTCGGGVQYKNYDMKDNNTNKVCSSNRDQRNCNTQSCGPSYTRLGNMLDGYLVPLSTTKFVEFIHDYEYPKNGIGTVQSSWVKARVIEIKDNKATYGSYLPIGSGMGTGDEHGTKINDNTIVYGGLSYLRYTSYKSYTGNPDIVVLKINGMNISVSQSFRLESRTAEFYDFEGIHYIQGSNEITFWTSKGSTYHDWQYYHYYLFNSSYSSVSKDPNERPNPYSSKDARCTRQPMDKEGLVVLPSYCGSREDVEVYTGLSPTLSAWLMPEISDKKLAGIYIDSSPSYYSTTSIPESTWTSYGEPYKMTHFGDTRLLLMTRSGYDKTTRKYTKIYFNYYEKQTNGTWKDIYHSDVSSFASSASFIPLSKDYLIYNTGAGLYLIKYQ